jgi:hypothetical protein
MEHYFFYSLFINQMINKKYKNKFMLYYCKIDLNFQDLFSMYKFFMLISKNCAINRNENFCLDDLQKNISKPVNPNLYTILKVPIVTHTNHHLLASFLIICRIKTWTRSTIC